MLPNATAPKIDISPLLLEEAEEAADILQILRHDPTAEQVRQGLAELRETATGEALAARLNGRVAGIITLHRAIQLHRPGPVGRIVSLAVREELQGRGIGSRLVKEAEAWFRSRGCVAMEVTSNVRREGAHRFYRGLGFEMTSYRFWRDL